MRWSVLVVVALGAAPACSVRESTRGPAVAAGPDVTTGPAVPVPSIPAVTTWELDPENSSANFVCKHVFSNVRGMFAQPAGTVFLDDATPANSKVDATLHVSSITTGVEERDTHLKSPDFFDAVRYPLVTFVSSGVQRSSASAYAVTGNLTMHGVTRPVTLAVAVSPPFQHAGGIRRGIEATTSVNRRDFGLLWDFPGEGTGVVVGDTIRITIDAELVLRPDAGRRG